MLCHKCIIIPCTAPKITVFWVSWTSIKNALSLRECLSAHPFNSTHYLIPSRCAQRNTSWKRPTSLTVASAIKASSYKSFKSYLKRQKQQDILLVWSLQSSLCVWWRISMRSWENYLYRTRRGQKKRRRDVQLSKNWNLFALFKSSRLTCRLLEAVFRLPKSFHVARWLRRHIWVPYPRIRLSEAEFRIEHSDIDLVVFCDKKLPVAMQVVKNRICAARWQVKELSRATVFNFWFEASHF